MPTDPSAPEVLQQRDDRPVVRIGDVVRHPRDPWSSSVHALLRHLHDSGFTQAPLPVRLTETDDEVSFMAGTSGDDACRVVADDDKVAEVAQLLRRYHDAVEGWQPEEEPVWFDGRRGTGGPGELVCHGDPGPWNMVWRDGELVGLIDWEYATVGTRREDIGYALHYLIPLRDRSYWHDLLGMTRRPRRHKRLRIFAEAYGIALDESLVEDVLAAQRAGVTLMKEMASRGRLRQTRQIEDGELEREQNAVLWGEGHRHQLLRALR
ncbi:hypothetical protein FHX74_003818 [Friedmanniella endophytica]|uniref:Aminoglycoside phosphotransferase domain-containing protein n=1 Tax=Microlunatus kandeliicorticis TaxID=1759536 RepID=A0A7W3IW19_9ACTN|nr:phosphotransferase [Microlunatus kandeliicorticis]MBA8796165.1 hypothetical protein [Microlunatus kandeliicorticis]